MSSGEIHLDVYADTGQEYGNPQDNSREVRVHSRIPFGRASQVDVGRERRLSGLIREAGVLRLPTIRLLARAAAFRGLGVSRPSDTKTGRLGRRVGGRLPA